MSAIGCRAPANLQSVEPNPEWQYPGPSSLMRYQKPLPAPVVWAKPRPLQAVHPQTYLWLYHKVIIRANSDRRPGRARRALRSPPARLFLVGWIDAVEFTQQCRPVEFVRIVAACGACTRFGIARADDRLGERVELGARLLKGQLHRAATLHRVGRDKGFGDSAPDDEQAVIAQYHNVLVA